METLDCRGKSCPVPVIETKKLIEEKGLSEVTVRVDNETSRENVRRFLESKGFGTRVEGQEDDFSIVARREEDYGCCGWGEAEGQEKALVKTKVTAFITSETLGRGDDTLGAILIKSFVVTLKELNPLPWRVILANGGVKLAADGSEVLPYLQELQKMGVEVLSCGTCLDFYNLKEKLRVGRASNMFEIVTSLTDSTTVLKP